MKEQMIQVKRMETVIPFGEFFSNTRASIEIEQVGDCPLAKLKTNPQHWWDHGCIGELIEGLEILKAHLKGMEK